MEAPSSRHADDQTEPPGNIAPPTHEDNDVAAGPQPRLDLDPSILKRLSAIVEMPKKLRAEPIGKFQDSRRLYDTVAKQVRTGAWREARATECASEPGEPTVTDGKAIVLDDNGKSRAFTMLGGTDDHYHELRLFFDENERLRLLFLKHAEVSGGAAEHVVAYDADGNVLACHRWTEPGGSSQWDLCANEAVDVKVDKDVEAALSAPLTKQFRNRLRKLLETLVPRREFARCAVR